VFLVDTNILIDLANPHATWRDWSAQALGDAMRAGPVAINPIIYAELSVAYDAIEVLDEALEGLGVLRLPLPYEAGCGRRPCRISTSALMPRSKTSASSRAILAGFGPIFHAFGWSTRRVAKPGSSSPHGRIRLRLGKIYATWQGRMTFWFGRYLCSVLVEPRTCPSILFKF
jgi:hypothetical protein